MFDNDYVFVCVACPRKHAQTSQSAASRHVEQHRHRKPMSELLWEILKNICSFVLMPVWKEELPFVDNDFVYICVPYQKRMPKLNSLKGRIHACMHTRAHTDTHTHTHACTQYFSLLPIYVHLPHAVVQIHSRLPKCTYLKIRC